MKINKAKLLVGTLAIASVAATVGSISGTVAWFQYSTRSTVEYNGASAHCTENLQVSLDGTNWSSDLTKDQVSSYLTSQGRADSNLYPVTSGNLAENAFPETLYKNPIYQYSGNYTTENNAWKAADNKDYVELPIQLRVVDVDGTTGSTPTLLAKKVYLSDIAIAAESVAGKLDITAAVRVAAKVGTTYACTWSLTGGSVATTGNLDLNNDGAPDKVKKFSWEANASDLFPYGTAASAAVSTAVTEKGTGKKLADDTDPYAIKGTELGTTVTTGTALTVTIRIYLEGWTALGTSASAIWNAADFVGAKFNVGLRFSAEAHDLQANHATPAPDPEP